MCTSNVKNVVQEIEVKAPSSLVGLKPQPLWSCSTILVHIPTNRMDLAIVSSIDETFTINFGTFIKVWPTTCVNNKGYLLFIPGAQQHIVNVEWIIHTAHV